MTFESLGELIMILAESWPKNTTKDDWRLLAGIFITLLVLIAFELIALHLAMPGLL